MRYFLKFYLIFTLFFSCRVSTESVSSIGPRCFEEILRAKFDDLIHSPAKAMEQIVAFYNKKEDYSFLSKVDKSLLKSFREYLKEKKRMQEALDNAVRLTKDYKGICAIPACSCHKIAENFLEIIEEDSDLDLNLLKMCAFYEVYPYKELTELSQAGMALFGYEFFSPLKDYLSLRALLEKVAKRLNLSLLAYENTMDEHWAIGAREMIENLLMEDTNITNEDLKIQIDRLCSRGFEKLSLIGEEFQELLITYYRRKRLTQEISAPGFMLWSN